MAESSLRHNTQRIDREIIAAIQEGPRPSLIETNDQAEEYASYCREYGLSFDRSDRNIENFDYVNYLWDGRRDEFMKPYANKSLPIPLSKKNSN